MTSRQETSAIRLLVFGITLLATMGISSLLPALPLLSGVFGVPIEKTWLIIAAFTLPGLFCLPFAGVLADRLGRKRVLLPSLLLFAAGGVACALAQTFAQLLLCRLIQGVGSASLGLMYTTIIADTWQGHERLTMMSRNAMVLGFGTAASPALGGALAMLDWRLPFLLPLSALPLVFLACRLPLLTPALHTGLRSYASACLTCVKERKTLLLLALTLLTFIMLSGPLITCFPMLAGQAFQASPLEVGLILAGASLAAGLAATRLPGLYRSFSARALLLAAMALYGVSFFSLALAPGLWWLLPAIIVYGLAQGLNIPLVSTLLTSQAPDGQRAALMALNGLLLRLGQNIGPAVFGTLAGAAGPAWAIVSGTIPAVLMALLALGIHPPLSREHAETAAERS